MYKDNSGNLTRVKQTVINDEKIAGNVFTYEVGSRKTGDIAQLVYLATKTSSYF